MRRRKIIQVICALLYNCNFTGFAKGKIYQGNGKGVCVPGLNCYSCPGAISSCPLGSLQTALVSSKYKIPYYILGILLLFGVLFGRVVCGFLCPFGLIQELCYMIPTKKLKKNKWTRRLSVLKYIILLIFVTIMPLALAVPAFCKYICPAGTLEGGVFLVAKNERLQALAGGLFSWKLAVLAVVIISAVFIFRSFCRFLCPLGAFYSLFHKVSVVGMKVDKEKCNGCNACVTNCKLDVKQVGDRECIQCGDCIGHCSRCALGFGKRGER
ncbi:MAG: 4Fe-4S binding protein [Clostridium sp.]|nr:4Fe-4S binding protein [Clostridium sp.]MCM1209217.1 4Fe-4S binding protein [Ruminococcus sp.]